MTNTKAYAVLADVTDETKTGIYKGAFNVPSKQSVTMNITNKGDDSMVFQLETKAGVQIIKPTTIKPHSEKAFTEILDGGDYTFSMDGQDERIPFKFRAVGS